MSASPTTRIRSYSFVIAGLLLGALALQRPELAAVASPFVVLLIAGLVVSPRSLPLAARVTLKPERALEGETLRLLIDIDSASAVDTIELALGVPEGLEVVGCDSGLLAVTLNDGATMLELPMLARRWGEFTMSGVHARAYGPLRLYRYDADLAADLTVRIYPRPETLRTLLRPARTRAQTGNQVARAKGEGIEFADIRPFVPGDRMHNVNWRATARHGGLWINERHPERNVDIVLFLDTFADVSSSAGSTLDEMVRAATSLASAWLAHHDRVGIIGFGGVLQWLEVGGGSRHVYRVVDTLLHTRVMFSYAWKGIEVIPSRLFPPGALVVALSPMLDERSLGALLDLRARGFDLAIIEVSPEPFVTAPTDEIKTLALRLWRLQREALRSRYVRMGVPVVAWESGTPLETVLVRIEAWRRRARLRAG